MVVQWVALEEVESPRLDCCLEPLCVQCVCFSCRCMGLLLKLPRTIRNMQVNYWFCECMCFSLSICQLCNELATWPG